MRLVAAPGEGLVLGELLACEVELLLAYHRRREPEKLWLWWHGAGGPGLGLLWRSYARRFDLEHAIKFCRGALGWTR